MATALYRRYRSARFAELIGQPHIAATLTSEVRSGRLAHAYLFAGVRGTGKTSTARILARAVNCLEPQEGEPCNRCSACSSLLAGSAVDVLEIDAASNRGIDDVREIREKVGYLPAVLRRKVYVIDEAHMLTADAWNAFLKTLEEPPAHAMFVLATTEPHRVPETVRSRSQRFDFRRVPTTEIASHLLEVATQEGVGLDAPAAALLARVAQGSVRDALSLLDLVMAQGGGPITAEISRRALGLADPDLVRDLVTALAQRQAGPALRATALAFESGVEAQQLVREVARLARGALLSGLGCLSEGAADTEDAELCAELAAAAPAGSWLEALELLGSTEMNLRQPVDARMQVEICLLRLIHPALRDQAAAATLASVQERLAALEQQLGQSDAPPRPAPGGAAAEPASPPPVPGRASEPTSEAVPSGVPQDLTGWLAAWPRFLEAMNRRDIMLGGLLKGCRPVDAAPGRLVIGALHRFHHEQIGESAKLALLATVAGEVAGGATVVEAVFAGEEGPRAGRDRLAEATREALEVFPGSRLVGSRPAGPDRSPPGSPAP